MKKYIIGSLLFVSLSFAHVWAAEDTQIVDQLTSTDSSDIKFTMQSFNSCQDMNTVMDDFMKKYYKNVPMPYYYRGGPIMMEDALSQTLDGVDSVASPQALTDKSTSSNEWSAQVDYSKTNTQVLGVDESEIIKTDGKYIYYVSDYYDNVTQKQQKYVYVVKATPANSMEVVRKIKLPDNFYGTDLYLTDNKLVILSTGYTQWDYNWYWVNRSTKTYVMVMNTSDFKLEKLYIVDGNYAQSRRIGDSLYVISQNSLQFPYYVYAKWGIDMPEFDIKKAMPKEIDITRSDDTASQNLTIKGKNLPYNVTGGNVAGCNEIEYILPDEETMKKHSFNPNYNIVSIINLADTKAKVTNKVIFGDNSQLYMSQNNMYMTSYLYTNTAYACPFNARCFAPMISTGENTLIHKLAVDKSTITYKNTAVVAGSPLNQYSMDEKDGKFRIITSQWSPERSTNLFILDENLQKYSSLTWLGKDENFQASRFIGDKLFLVTFQQIDPLFAIELKDQKNPKILGELKIPGYSTYLHPYDETHLIGLGYDTKTNQWGGTQQNGVKVDLYQINYDKKCGDSNLTALEKKGCEDGTYKGIIVKQQYTANFGEQGSYSEALNNPRMFIWNPSKKLLLLPATLYWMKDATSYKYKDFFQGLLGINIDASTGIKQKFKVTHIDTWDWEAKRLEECKQYSAPKTTEPVCRKLVDGSTYCEPTTGYTYIPEYCYADSTAGEYIAYKSWEFQPYFINRALYIGDTAYSLSNKMIEASDVVNPKTIGTVELK